MPDWQGYAFIESRKMEAFRVEFYHYLCSVVFEICFGYIIGFFDFLNDHFKTDIIARQYTPISTTMSRLLAKKML